MAGPLRILVAALAIFFFSCIMMAEAAAATQCKDYTTEGSPAGKFTFYRFYDFRSAPIPATDVHTGVWSASRYKAKTMLQNKTTTDNSWTNDWYVQVQDKERAAQHLTEVNYMEKNVYMNGKKGAAYLSLKTNRLDSDTQEAGQIYYHPADAKAISLRVSARITGYKGAIAGMFTYHSDTQESDMEVLTKDGEHTVHFSNQPVEDSDGKEVAGSTMTKTLPEGENIGQFNVYRLDWLPGKSAWYVNGKKLASSTTNVPTISSSIFINMWNNNGPFGGNMAVGKSARLDVQWIEMAFNSTTKPSDPVTSGATCTLDKTVGTPVASSGVRARMKRSFRSFRERLPGGADDA